MTSRAQTNPEPALARAAVVVVAAGRSTRLIGGPGALVQRKPWLALGGRSVLEHTLGALDAVEQVVEIVLVAHADDVERCERLCAERAAFAKVRAVVAGGAERADSVRRGVFWCGFDVDVIAVHDAARPLVAPAAIARAVATAAREGAALVAIPVQDTLKVSSDGRRAESTLERSVLWIAQTPQAFAAARFRELVRRAEREGFRPTDDAALWERYVGPVALVPGDPTNLKITTRADLAIAQAILAARAEEPPEGDP